jgi:hypothetical protein
MKKFCGPAADIVEWSPPPAPRSRAAAAKAAFYRQEAERVRRLATEASHQGRAGYERAAGEYAALAEFFGG